MIRYMLTTDYGTCFCISFLIRAIGHLNSNAFFLVNTTGANRKICLLCYELDDL